jgi:formylglycine-generating enzyme required for sulfatase activity
MGSMGSPPRGYANEEPQHLVTITNAFAVAKFELTFDEWNTCVLYGDCATAGNSGGGQRPVVNVSWDDAQRYVAWLSTVTGKPYRLLTEAEYEYVRPETECLQTGGAQGSSWVTSYLLYNGPAT